jgi:hypothetical protein
LLLSPLFISFTFLKRLLATNGPFLIDLDTA